MPSKERIFCERIRAWDSGLGVYYLIFSEHDINKRSLNEAHHQAPLRQDRAAGVDSFLAVREHDVRQPKATP